MSLLISVLLVCYAMVSSVYSTPIDREGKVMPIGRNALPQTNKNSDIFAGFAGFDNEAKDWVEAHVERTYAVLSDAVFDDGLYNDLFGVLIDDTTNWIMDGIPIESTKVKSRLKIMLTLSHLTSLSDSDDIIFTNDATHWGPYFVKYYVDVEESLNPGYHYIATITVNFRDDGRIKDWIFESPDGHLSAILEQAKNVASAAFTVTDFIGDIAKSVNMEDVYLQYVVYIFFFILFGMAITVILLTACCIKVVLLGENKNKYKQVSTVSSSESPTDSEL